MPEPLRIVRDDAGPTAGVFTIFLDDPGKPVTVLDREMIGRLDATLDMIGDAAAGLVLASSHGRVFVAGADLKEISDLPDEDLDEYLAQGQRVLGRISAAPCCTVAAINGAALGGGLELALHCDALLGVEPANPDKPYRVGLPEASLGLCPGWGGTNTLPARVEPGRAVSATSAGRTFTAFEALEHGLLETLHPDRDALLAAAKTLAAGPKPERGGRAGEPRNISDPEIAPGVRSALARFEREAPHDAAAEAVVSCVKAGLDGGFASALAHERESLIALRSTETARTKIDAFFARATSR